MAKMTTKKVKSDERVYAKDVVEIEYTEEAAKHGHSRAGDKSTVHKVMAQKLVGKGFAKYVNKDDDPSSGKKSNDYDEI